MLGEDADGNNGQEKGQWNPLCLKIPLFRPDPLLTRLLPWTSWLFSFPATAAAALLGMVGGPVRCFRIGHASWKRLEASCPQAGGFGIGIAWLAIKVIHELAHGIVCKRYSGNARQAGVVLILGAPIAYVDVTSSWRFRSKWQRIHTAAAGIYVELLISAIAAIAWCNLQPGVVSDLCFQTIVIAGVATILFNANPLMRFDGYYILTDLLNLPNLAPEGQQFVRHLARRTFLGVPSHLSWGWKKYVAVSCYAAAAFVWRFLVFVSILTAAASAFRGAGILLAAVGLAFWIIPPLYSTSKYLLVGERWEQPKRLRVLFSTVGLTAFLALSAVLLPWPGSYRAPAVATYAHSVAGQDGSKWLCEGTSSSRRGIVSARGRC